MSDENRLFVVGSMISRRHLPLFVRLGTDELRKAMDKGAARDFSRKVNWGTPKKELRFDRPDIHNISFTPVEKEKDPKAEKAIQGQQGLMQPIGPQDPIYATHAARGKPSEDMHIDAAKHYIQADFHGRSPGGWNQAQEHHKQYMNLRKQGANPTADHFKTAMQELHPKFTQAMKSKNPPLFLKALTGEFRAHHVPVYGEMKTLPDAPKDKHDGMSGSHQWEKYHDRMTQIHTKISNVLPSDHPAAAGHKQAAESHKKAVSTIRESSRKVGEHGVEPDVKTMQNHSRRAMTQSENAFRHMEKE